METSTLSPILMGAGLLITLGAIYFTARQPRPPMTPFLWVIGVGLFTANLWLLFAPTSSSAALPTNPIARTADSIAKGEALYVANCLRCHGEDFGGDGPEAASLTVPPANLREHFPFHEDGFHFNLITNGVGGMPALGAQVVEEDRWHIINYLRESTAADGEGEHGGGVEHSHEDDSEHSHE
jgi:mono/diheme cytochrome c family protein